MKKIAVVVPTIREKSIKKFLIAWEKEFKNLNMIVIEDNPTKTFNLPRWINHYSWKEIDIELNKNSWIIPRRSAAIRSFGFLKAWQTKLPYIITLDDDCLPEKRFKNKGFMKEIITALEKKWDADQWTSTMEGNIYPRGYPYGIRKDLQKTWIHQGMWSNIPDIDGITQKKYPNFRTKPFNAIKKIPKNSFFPMSAANLAFRREILPSLYFLLMGQSVRGGKWQFERFDDVWAGLFCKKICDHLGFAVSCGFPSVHHDRASNVDENLRKEKKGIAANEWLWKKIEAIPLTKKTVKENYLEFADKIAPLGSYWKTLSEAMRIWISLLK